MGVGACGERGVPLQHIGGLETKREARAGPGVTLLQFLVPRGLSHPTPGSLLLSEGVLSPLQELHFLWTRCLWDFLQEEPAPRTEARSSWKEWVIRMF